MDENTKALVAAQLTEIYLRKHSPERTPVNDDYLKKIKELKLDGEMVNVFRTFDSFLTLMNLAGEDRYLMVAGKKAGPPTP